VKDEVDPAFQNAQYWLLFPLHLSWDGGAKVEETGIHELPLGKGSATRVVVTYPPEGGYTPGDVLKLFVGADGRVRRFIWRPFTTFFSVMKASTTRRPPQGRTSTSSRKTRKRSSAQGMREVSRRRGLRWRWCGIRSRTRSWRALLWARDDLTPLDMACFAAGRRGREVRRVDGNPHYPSHRGPSAATKRACEIAA